MYFLERGPTLRLTPNLRVLGGEMRTPNYNSNLYSPPYVDLMWAI